MARDNDDLDLDSDRLHEECGVFGIFGHSEAAAITTLGLHASTDFDRFDHIVTMDEENYRNITSMAQTESRRAQVIRMSSYLKEHPGATSVPDPYYGGDRDFELALDLIEDGCRHLLKHLTCTNSIS